MELLQLAQEAEASKKGIYDTSPEALRYAVRDVHKTFDSLKLWDMIKGKEHQGQNTNAHHTRFFIYWWWIITLTWHETLSLFLVCVGGWMGAWEYARMEFRTAGITEKGIFLAASIFDVWFFTKIGSRSYVFTFNLHAL